MLKSIQIILLVFLLEGNLFSQSNTLNLPFKVGIILEYGSHLQRLGFMASFYTTFRNHEFDFEYRTYYNFKNLGPPLKYWENSFSAGYTFGFGKKRPAYEVNSFYMPIISHLDEQFGLSYNLSFFHNKIGTKQFIGAISYYIDDVIISIENDLFGNTKGKDRFRTGSLTLAYVTNDFLFSLNNVIWTGETKCANAQKFPNRNANDQLNNPSNSRWGYKDISRCPFGRFSHGILNAKVVYKPSNFFNQNYSASFGLDSEHIRHFFQNKLMHDMYFLPKKFIKSKNLHYPKLDENGVPFMNQEEQILLKNRAYFQLGQNAGWNY